MIMKICDYDYDYDYDYYEGIIMKALYLFLGSWLMTNPYLTSYYYFILTFDYISVISDTYPMQHILSLISVSYYFVVISVHWAF